MKKNVLNVDCVLANVTSKQYNDRKGDLDMSEMVKLNIDGKDVEIEKGSTVLQAARKANIEIPTLCFLKDINQAGDCRMCIVDIEGRRGFVPSCITQVEEGMVVKTDTPAVNESRRIMLDLILSTHNRDCLTCTRNGKSNKR